MLTMRSEEKENFRLVSPMMMAVIRDYAEMIERSGIDLVRILLSGHCASNAQQLEVGETGEAATSRLRREFKGSP